LVLSLDFGGGEKKKKRKKRVLRHQHQQRRTASPEEKGKGLPLRKRRGCLLSTKEGQVGRVRVTLPLTEKKKRRGRKSPS